MATPNKRNRQVPEEHRDFGPWLRNRRLELEMTQGALSEKTKISQSQISDLENVVLIPSVEMVKRFAGPLEVSEAEILLAAGYKPTGERVRRKGGRMPSRKEIIASLVDDLPESGQESALRLVQEIHAVYRLHGRTASDDDIAQ